MLLPGCPAWTYAMLTGVVMSFIAGVLGAWVLLMEILR
jgi:hypothetical protein